MCHVWETHKCSPLSLLLVARIGCAWGWLTPGCVHWWELVCTWKSERTPVPEVLKTAWTSILEREKASSQPWGKTPAQEALVGKGMCLPFLLPRFSLSKLLWWIIITFHFIFKNCCQGSLLVSWSQHKSENTLLQGNIFKTWVWKVISTQ